MFNAPFSVNLFLKVSRLHSSLLAVIAMNFCNYVNDPCIALINAEEFKLVLRSKKLAVNNEDEVVQAIVFWSRHNSLKQTE